MEYRVVMTMAAEDDLRQAHSWYGRIHHRLKDGFVSDVDWAIKKLILQPLAYVAQRKNVRRILLKKFPYALYYRIEGNMIVVFSVFHSYQDPVKWQIRVSS